MLTSTSHSFKCIKELSASKVVNINADFQETVCKCVLNMHKLLVHSFNEGDSLLSCIFSGDCLPLRST